MLLSDFVSEDQIAATVPVARHVDRVQIVTKGGSFFVIVKAQREPGNSMVWPYHRPILHGDPGSGEGRGSVPPTFFGFWTLSHHGASGAQLTQLDPTDPKGPFSCHESAKDVAAAGSIWFYPLRFTAADRCLQHWHIEGIHEVACQVGCQMLPARCCLMLSSLFAENKASIYSSMSGPNS